LNGEAQGGHQQIRESGQANRKSKVKSQNAKCKTTIQKSKMTPIGLNWAYLNSGAPFFSFDMSFFRLVFDI
jgi:hypothetical protein